MSVLLEIDAVSRAFRGLRAVDCVSLAIEQGEIVGLPAEASREPRQGRGKAILVADQLAAEFEHPGIARSEL